MHLYSVSMFRYNCLDFMNFSTHFRLKYTVEFGNDKANEGKNIFDITTY